MNINWYPGHMKKTHDLIKQNLKLVDCVVELLDARIPNASKNPVFESLIANKPRVIALNKCDLADDVKLKRWIEHYANMQIEALPIDAVHGKGIKTLVQAVKSANSSRQAKFERQNRINKKVRMMIIGIPNVGKSSLINQLAGKKAAKTGNKPGVTKGKQWIRLDGDLELFDTPGILWPKIESDRVGLNLAYTGSIKDEILPIEDIALYFIRDVFPQYSQYFLERYQLDDNLLDAQPIEVMDAIAKRRGCILSKDNYDYHRVARLVLDEFRKGTIGKMTIEMPEDLSNI